MDSALFDTTTGDSVAGLNRGSLTPTKGKVCESTTRTLHEKNEEEANTNSQTDTIRDKVCQNFVKKRNFKPGQNN